MPPRAPLLTPPAALSQVPSEQGPDRRRAHAVRAAYRADGSVSRRTSPPPPASKPWHRVEGGKVRRVATRRGSGARRTCHPLRASPFPHDLPLRRPSRRYLGNNDLTGGVPSQFGLLTALKHLGSTRVALALCTRRRSPMISRSGAPLAGTFTTTRTWAAACPRSLGCLPRWSTCEPPHLGTPTSKP
eukprot:scaffold45850_cov45-Phaeocystis_antarctica.AAC.1